jgi:hypothetical protein
MSENEPKKLTYEIIDPNDFSKVLIASAIMAASAQHDRGPEVDVETNYAVIVDKEFGDRYLLASWEGKPCTIAYSNEYGFGSYCLPYFRQFGIEESLKEPAYAERSSERDEDLIDEINSELRYFEGGEA